MIRIIVLGFLIGFFLASIALANARDDGQWTRNPDPRAEKPGSWSNRPKI